MCLRAGRSRREMIGKHDGGVTKNSVYLMNANLANSSRIELNLFPVSSWSTRMIQRLPLYQRSDLVIAMIMDIISFC